MRRLLALLLLFVAPSVLAREQEGQHVSGDAILEHVRWLADDEREGRAAGSEGERAAGDYIAARLQALGLEPAGDEGTFFQNFSLPRGFTVGKETRLVAEREGKSVALSIDRELKPLSLSAPGEVSGDAVFLGYGIAAPDLGYDDYDGVDVKGKVAIVLRHAPAYDDRDGPFFAPAARNRYAVFQAKADAAAGAGAAALVLVNDPLHARKPKDDVPMQDVGGNPVSIPVLHVSYAAGRRLARLCGLNLQKEQSALDGQLKPRSRALEGIRVTLKSDLVAQRLPVRNVSAILRAARAVETLVVGAHYDHVGLGAYGSLAAGKGKSAIHNGADDNASGTATVLEIAAFLSRKRAELRRNVHFLFFTAEELGLLGSAHYVDHPVVPLADCVAMVNLDMVGRLERGRLQVGGTGTSPVFPDLLNAKNRVHRVEMKQNPGGRAPSDNTSFYNKGMPVLFFFTGLHKDYHRPTDDASRVDRKGIERVARLAADVCFDLATRETRPPFTRSDASGLDAGPFLGLSLEQKGDGIYVIHVEEKSPAARAGVRLGDKVEEFQDQPVSTVSAFQQVHSSCQEGEKVSLVVRRGPRLVKLSPTLGKS
ncbi:MAG: M20/M25/M40 family metallo-hydrolase [Planctomycetota bacterium]